VRQAPRTLVQQSRMQPRVRFGPDTLVANGKCFEEPPVPRTFSFDDRHICHHVGIPLEQIYYTNGLSSPGGYSDWAVGRAERAT
jgi:hypothetical protein